MLDASVVMFLLDCLPQCEAPPHLWTSLGLIKTQSSQSNVELLSGRSQLRSLDKQDILAYTEWTFCDSVGGYKRYLQSIGRKHGSRIKAGKRKPHLLVYFSISLNWVGREWMRAQIAQFFHFLVKFSIFSWMFPHLMYALRTTSRYFSQINYVCF